MGKLQWSYKNSPDMIGNETEADIEEAEAFFDRVDEEAVRRLSKQEDDAEFENAVAERMRELEMESRYPSLAEEAIEERTSQPKAGEKFYNNSPELYENSHKVTDDSPPTVEEIEDAMNEYEYEGDIS